MSSWVNVSRRPLEQNAGFKYNMLPCDRSAIGTNCTSQVWVMVVDVEEGPGGMPKLACSMRAVDQESGQALMSLQEAAQRRDSRLTASRSDPTAVWFSQASPDASCLWPTPLGTTCNLTVAITPTVASVTNFPRCLTCGPKI